MIAWSQSTTALVASASARSTEPTVKSSNAEADACMAVAMFDTRLEKLYVCKEAISRCHVKAKGCRLRGIDFHVLDLHVDAVGDRGGEYLRRRILRHALFLIHLRAD